MNRGRWSGLVIMGAIGVGVWATGEACAQEWIEQLGTPERDHAKSLVSDGLNGLIVAGQTNGSLMGHTAGDWDLFLARYNENGSRVWGQQFGTVSSDTGGHLVATGTGTFVLVGSTRGSLGGPIIGTRDIFVTEFDIHGSRLWARQIGTIDFETANGISVDGAGGFYVAGSTGGDWVMPQLGNNDAILVRLDATGSLVWVRQFGTSERDDILAVASDGMEGAFVVGTTHGSLASPNNGGRDWFIARFDGKGNRLWINQYGSIEQDFGLDIIADDAGGAYVAGESSNMAFVGRFASSGEELWMRELDSGNPGSSDYFTSLAVDPSGGVIATGGISGSLGGPSAGRDDIGIVRFDGFGNQTWAIQIGSEFDDRGVGIVCDSASTVSIAGRTWGDLGAPNLGTWDTVIARFETPPCFVDCDESTGVGKLDIFDFLCFQTVFVNGGSYACDCDTSTGVLVCDVFDFLCFQDAFVAGCP